MTATVEARDTISPEIQASLVRSVAPRICFIDMSPISDAGSALSSTVRPTRTGRVLFAGAALCGALLAGGCKSFVGARATTVQGKHGHKTCVQLLAQHKSTSARIDELEGLIRKAEQEAAGPFIGAAVYGTTLVQARGERRFSTKRLRRSTAGSAG